MERCCLHHARTRSLREFSDSHLSKARLGSFREGTGPRWRLAAARAPRGLRSEVWLYGYGGPVNSPGVLSGVVSWAIESSCVIPLERTSECQAVDLLTSTACLRGVRAARAVSRTL
jgi:hypothetical protein